MERHTSSPTHTHTEDSWHFQPMQLPLWGSKGPKSLLGTRSVQQSLAKRKFSSTLGQSLPVSKRKNRPTCWLIKFFSKPCSFRISFHKALQRKESMSVSFGLIISLFSADNLSKYHHQSLIFSEVLSPVLFSSFLLLYLPKWREQSLTFFSIFATLLRGDVVHNSRFSHLVYSLSFFTLVPSLSLLPAVNDWSGTDRPPLRSVLLQRCPLSCFSLFLFPLSFTSIHLPPRESLRLY